MDPIRVLLCNHHPIIRSGLRLLLEREPGIRVVGEAANGREGVALTDYRRPDIVRLDVATREISAKAENAGIVFVSEQADDEYVTEAFKAGADTYSPTLRKRISSAIRVVVRGGWFLSPSITSHLLDEYSREQCSVGEPFSENEKRLFCLLAAGYDEQEIAENFKLCFRRGKV